MHQNHLESLEKHRLLGPSLEFLTQQVWGWAQEFVFLASFRDHTLRTCPMMKLASRSWSLLRNMPGWFRCWALQIQIPNMRQPCCRPFSTCALKDHREKLAALQSWARGKLSAAFCFSLSHFNNFLLFLWLEIAQARLDTMSRVDSGGGWVWWFWWEINMSRNTKTGWAIGIIASCSVGGCVKLALKQPSHGPATICKNVILSHLFLAGSSRNPPSSAYLFGKGELRHHGWKSVIRKLSLHYHCP